MGKAFNTFLAISTGGLSIPITKAFSDSSNKGGGQVSEPVAPLPLPSAPDKSAIEEKAQNNVTKRRALNTQSVYTSPLGVSGQAGVIRKTLTGQ